MTKVHTYLIRYPSASLLFVQLLGIVLYPFMGQLSQGRAIVGAFGIVVLAMSLRMVRSSPTIQWIAFTQAACILALTIAVEYEYSTLLAVLLAGMESSFYFYAAGGLIAYMMEDLRASTDELFAVGATFTLLAWAFAHAFSVCQLLLPGSFTAAVNPEAARTWVELLYLSFTVLSGVGLSDILPLKPFARALVMLEQFAGVMYIGLVVTRLVTLTVRQRSS
ncbi:ion channel [Phytopseudomonas seleniipraecipitans]|uniref:Ion channel n=1 Tax=Phytopseudomonas seleniipraecipitans TaxID=640205 RepID=A0A1G7HTB0_9GAMM|nr:ion channel [Pseudomonas seleniipraecipitans]SDF03494.1 Ion channel [Pseudomonas seleniipraecipitans]